MKKDKFEYRTCLFMLRERLPLSLFLYLNSCRVGAVAKTQHGGNDEQKLNTQRLPYPAAEEGDEDGDNMVDRNTGGDGGLGLVGTIGEILNVYVGGHGGLGDYGVQYVVYTADDKSDILGENVVCKAVEEADDNENKGVCNHYHLIAQLVDNSAHDGGSEEAGDGVVISRLSSVL